jgi:hypothetical protein
MRAVMANFSGTKTTGSVTTASTTATANGRCTTKFHRIHRKYHLLLASYWQFNYTICLDAQTLDFTAHMLVGSALMT